MEGYLEGSGFRFRWVADSHAIDTGQGRGSPFVLSFQQQFPNFSRARSDPDTPAGSGQSLRQAFSPSALGHFPEKTRPRDTQGNQNISRKPQEAYCRLIRADD